MQIERPHATFCVGNSYVWPILSVTVCKIVTFEIPNVLLFESLTFKIEIKVVDDLNENWLAEVTYQRAYVCKNWRF